MSQNRSGLPILPILLGAGVILLGVILLGAVFYLILASAAGGQVQATPTLAVAAGRTLSFPTATTIPSATPTPTETPTPTSTPTLTPTNTPVPPTRPPATAVPPTAIPTATPIPATAVPPGYAHGLVDIVFFPLRTNWSHDEVVWWHYKIMNGSQNLVGFGFLGTNALDMAGTFVVFQASWQGPDSGTKIWLNPGQGLEYDDHFQTFLSAGTYQIQLVICYSAPGVCNTPGAGDWEPLSPLITITVN